MNGIPTPNNNIYTSENYISETQGNRTKEPNSTIKPASARTSTSSSVQAKKSDPNLAQGKIMQRVANFFSGKSKVRNNKIKSFDKNESVVAFESNDGRSSVIM